MVAQAEEVVRFDVAARVAAQQWMREFQAHCNKEPPNELFKLFKRDTTVCSLLCHALRPALLTSNAASIKRDHLHKLGPILCF